jgi:hypothetical protein
MPAKRANRGGPRPAANTALEVVWQEELSERSNATATPVRKYRQEDTADLRNLFNINDLQAGDLGFEPSFLAFMSQGDDTGLTLENPELHVFTIHPAPIYIVAALG